MEEPPWKKIKLSLERPYKNDDGERIPVLLDITAEGTHIYEPKDDPAKGLGERLERIFVERGIDFFDKNQGRLLREGILMNERDFSETEDDMHHDRESPEEIQDQPNHAMTPEELFKMRMEILPQLYTALGETSHAKELISLLLASTSATQPSSQPSSTVNPTTVSTVTATIVTKPSAIPSVQAFNAQLVVGGKDEALRKAADIFKTAAESMERGQVRGDKYWVDALKIRRANWGLTPAPLPFGSATGKGAEKTSKDFLISFGLEESPPQLRRRAIGHMATYETDSGALVFPHRQRTRLRVSLRTLDSDGSLSSSHNTIVSVDDGSLEGSLRAAQQEVVEQEIFSMLIREAGNLPTASAQVSERLIVIDAAPGIELLFELINEEDSLSLQTGNESTAAKCDLIASVLHAFLLRIHLYQKNQRLGSTGIVRVAALLNTRPLPPLLQPIIDLLQYQGFCERVKAEVDMMVRALGIAGVPCGLRFMSVGKNGKELAKLLNDDSTPKIGGEAILRIDDRHTLRLTFTSPSSLTAHLPQATLALASIPQLVQMLSDEIEHCLLNRICELGSDICDRVNGTWFVDAISGRSVGRWEGCVLNFRVFYGNNFSIFCSAFRLDRGHNEQETLLETYSADSTMPLLSWVQQTIAETLSVL